jgi:hypothetical protein
MGMSHHETKSGKIGEQTMSNEPKDIEFGDPEFMGGVVEEAPIALIPTSCPHFDCEGICMVITDVTGDDIIAKQDAEDV